MVLVPFSSFDKEERKSNFRANLSDNYFTNRQDRYVLFNDSKSLADFFDNLVKTVGNFSFKMKHDNTLTLPDDESVHPFTGESSVSAQS